MSKLGPGGPSGSSCAGWEVQWGCQVDSGVGGWLGWRKLGQHPGGHACFSQLHEFQSSQHSEALLISENMSLMCLTISLPSLYANNFQRINEKQIVYLGMGMGQNVPTCCLEWNSHNLLKVSFISIGLSPPPYIGCTGLIASNTVIMYLDFLSCIFEKPRNSTILLKNTFLLWKIAITEVKKESSSQTNLHVPMTSFNNH